MDINELADFDRGMGVNHEELEKSMERSIRERKNKLYKSFREEDLKTKSQALRFAKAYMRKH